MIRRLIEADIPALWATRLRALREEPEAFGSDYAIAAAEDPAEVSARFVRQWATGDVAVYGAFVDDGLVGIATVFRESGLKARHSVSIFGMYVAPEARGRGLGRDLLSAAIAHARTLPGVDRVALSVVTTRLAARALYESLGFVAYGTEPRALRVNGQDLDEAHMTLDLTLAC